MKEKSNAMDIRKGGSKYLQREFGTIHPRNIVQRRGEWGDVKLTNEKRGTGGTARRGEAPAENI